MDSRLRLTSLRARIAFYATLASLLLIVALTAFQLDALRRDLRQVLDAQQSALVEQVALDIDAKLRQDLDVLKAAAGAIPADALRTPAALRAQLGRDAGLLALFDDILVLDATGQVVADVPELAGRTAVNAADRKFFQDVLRTGRGIISDPVLSKYRQEPIVNVAAPLRDAAGHVAGVVVGVLRLSQPNALGSLAAARVGRTGYFVLLTRAPDPVYIVHPDPERILQPRSRFGGNAATTAALAGASGTFEDVSTRGMHALFTYRPLQQADWLLIAVLPAAEAFAPVRAAERELALAAMILAAVVALAVWWLVDHSLAPLVRLRNHLQAMRSPGSEVGPAPVERRDEVGDLAETFNGLMEDRSRAAARLEEQSQALQLAAKVYETTADAVMISDADDRVLMVNPAFTRMTGYAADEVVGRLLAQSPFRPTDPEESARRMATQQRQGFVTGEVLRYRKDGSELPLWVSASNVTDEQGRVTHLVRVFTDISHLKASQRRLESLADSDALTGLANRRVFDGRLHAALVRSAAGGSFALLFVDLDAFKPVNDTLGHEKGDELLRAVGARLQSCVRVGDTLCRYGGDEFAVILEGEAAPEDAERVAERMLAACAQPFAVAGERVHVYASIGIAVYPDDGTDEATLLNAADAAMYAAKRAGGNRCARGGAGALRVAS